MAFTAAAVVALGLALLHDPAPAVSVPTATSASTSTAVAYDDGAEAQELKRRLAADRADRAARPEPAATASPPPAPPAPPAAAPAPRRKRVAAPSRPHTRRTAPTGGARPATPVYVAPADGSRAAVVVAFALAQVGKPYVWAAAGPGAYDCSGLVMAAYRQVGISLPHQTGGIVGRGRRVGRGELQPGDVVFPESGHVGIYIGGGRMVHAPEPGERVKVSSVYAFWTARRLL